jgi:hypothetical protein
VNLQESDFTNMDVALSVGNCKKRSRIKVKKKPFSLKEM